MSRREFVADDRRAYRAHTDLYNITVGFVREHDRAHDTVLIVTDLHGLIPTYLLLVS
jgi:hypothetical protein